MIENFFADTDGLRRKPYFMQKCRKSTGDEQHRQYEQYGNDGPQRRFNQYSEKHRADHGADRGGACDT